MKHDFTDSDTLDQLQGAIDELLNDGRDAASGKAGCVLLISLPSGRGTHFVQCLSNLEDESAVFLMRSAAEEYDYHEGADDD